MTLYLLDTNILSDAIKNPQGKVALYLSSLDKDETCTSIIVAAEMRYGAYKKGTQVLIDRVELLLEHIDVLPLDGGVDRYYAQIRTLLETKGTIIGANDLLIAAHALTLDATLVTDNVSEFQRVDGLTVENWLRP